MWKLSEPNANETMKGYRYISIHHLLTCLSSSLDLQSFNNFFFFGVLSPKSYLISRIPVWNEHHQVPFTIQRYGPWRLRWSQNFKMSTFLLTTHWCRLEGVWYTCFVVWKYVWKYVWMKKCMKIRVMLFKNWKCVFEWVYQTPP